MISEFCGLSPKTYSILLSDYMIQRLLQLISNTFLNIFGINIITNVVYSDIECVLLNIDKNISHQIFINEVLKIKFNLTHYYISKVTFNDNSINSRKPISKVFYDNNLYKSILSNKNNNINYYYIEICDHFDIHVYKYNLDSYSHSIVNNNVTLWELFYQKSKAAKGIPFSIKHKLTNTDYKQTMLTKNQCNFEVEYFIITNQKGCIKTIPQKKTALKLQDVKRYWVSNTESYAYCSLAIPSIDRLPFHEKIDYDSDIDISATNETGSDNTSIVSDTNINTTNEIISDNVSVDSLISSNADSDYEISLFNKKKIF